MKKITLQTNLSVQNIKNLKNQLEEIKQAYQNGSENFVRLATERFYELVISNCGNYNISNPLNRIHAEITDDGKIGRVYTDDMVIIFNEFGTGIKGIQDEWADKYNYQVNKSGKGEIGWWYPTDDKDPNPYKWVDKSGQLRVLTHGLESRHMFYDALIQLQSELSEMIEITFGKALGDLY